MKAWFLSLVCLGLAACSQIDLKSDSGLYEVQLKRVFKADLDGAWVRDKPHPHSLSGPKRIYVAPVDARLLGQEYAKRGELLARYMDEQMRTRLLAAFEESHQENPALQFYLVPSAQQADIVVRMAIVDFSPQIPVARSMVDTVMFFLSPIPGMGIALAPLTQGDIVLEGTISEGRTGDLLVAFKDSNRANAYFYEPAGYSALGRAKKSLRFWAKRVSKAICFAESQPDGYQGLEREVRDSSFWKYLFYPEF